MNIDRRDCILRGGALLATLATGTLAAPARAQAYPSAPVRIIVPYGPGAATDTIARLLARELQAALGGSFIVENRPGGGSRIGTRQVLDAPADGHTLGFIDTAFVINPGLVTDLPYDTRRDFAALTLAATAQLVLVVHRSVEAMTIARFVELAKAKPGHYSFASAGVGSAPHLAGEQFRVEAGIAVNHVAYKGGAAVFTDLLAGHVHFGFTTVPSMAEHIRSGAMRALAVTGSERSRLLPDVPTMAESGLPGVDAMPLFGLVAPAGVPAAIRSRLGEVASASVRTGALNAKLTEMGFRPVGSEPAAFQATVDAEIDKWTGIIRKAGIRPDR